jgi:xylulose-5-phosphate/fructose-6-phosphate phosphoketolase
MNTSDITTSYLNAEELDHLDRWWRAANYLSVGQIYLLDNALLREPLLRAHIKPRLLGHWHDSWSELHLRPSQPGDPGP